MSGSSDRQLSRGKLIVFSVITTLVVLASANAVIEWLGRQGAVDLHRPDDRVQFVEEALIEADGDDWATTAYAQESMVPSRFPQAKGDGWRGFLLGGSFAMGTPYSHQEDGKETPGGIASFWRAGMQARWPDVSMDVLNMGAGGEDSHRVKRIVEEVVQYEPDVLVIASCNNEGNASPSAMREYLHTLGGYRLMTKLLAPTESLEGRETHTVQQSIVTDLRDQFTGNVETMVLEAEKRGVPLLLATLPANLRYTGYSMSPFADGADITQEITREKPSECVLAGRTLHEEGKHAEAIEALSTCDDVGEALRWIGLAQLASGDAESAKASLKQSIELLPRNRCRPSFNAVLREMASKHEHVTLLDLEAAAERAAEDGIPGYDLFLDFCHMNWRGYALMAEELMATLGGAGLLPEGDAASAKTIEELGAQLGMADVETMGRVQAARWD